MGSDDRQTSIFKLVRPVFRTGRVRADLNVGPSIA